MTLTMHRRRAASWRGALGWPGVLIWPGMLVLTALLSGAAPAAALTLNVDPARTAITFVIHRPGETIEGTAPGVSGSLTFDPERPASGSSVILMVDPNQMETGNGMRDRKMKRTGAITRC